MFTIIGIIAATLFFAIVSGYPFVFAVMCLGGFDEYKPLAGLVFLLIFFAIWVAWWFLVGTHINIQVSAS